MAYHDIAGWSQIIAMTIFGTVMAGFIVYAFRPANRKKFETAAQMPLMTDDDLPEPTAQKRPVLRDKHQQGERHGRS